MRVLKTVTVLLMLAFWVPATSHTLLESAGVIHTEDSQHDGDHDAAEGLCVNATTHVAAPQPILALVPGPAADLEFWQAVLDIVDGAVAEAICV